MADSALGSYGIVLSILFCLVCSGTDARAQGNALPLIPNVPNFIGGGLGVVNDYPGSDDFLIGGLPVGRLALGGERNVELLGTYLGSNVINDPNIRFGPIGNYRFGRKDVDDSVVSQVHEIDDTIELGFTVGGEWIFEDDVRHRFRVGADVLFDVANSYDGYVADLFARYWFPIGKAVDVGLGVSASYGSAGYMDTYFGVNAADSARSGLQQYHAGAGFRAVRLFPMVMVHLSKSWHLGFGGRYSRLLSDAADSPIVQQRGSVHQVVAGAGIGYAW